MTNLPGCALTKKLAVASSNGQPEKSTKKANGQGGGTHWLGAVNFRGCAELHRMRGTFIFWPHLSAFHPHREGAFRLRLRLLGDSEGCLYLTLGFSHLGELATAVEDCACLLIGDAEGFFNLSASYSAIFSDVSDNLISEFSVGNLCLSRLVGLVALALVEQFEFMSAETYDFSVIGADFHNLVQHFSLCHNHHLLPFLSLCDFSIQHFSHVVKPFFKVFLFFYSNSFSLGNQADWQSLLSNSRLSFLW